MTYKALKENWEKFLESDKGLKRVYRNMRGCTGLSSFWGRLNEYLLVKSKLSPLSGSVALGI